jgi:hypothetical protein
MRLSVILIALLLGGCGDKVVSRTPWFSAADAAGAPALRDGLWIAPITADCRPDERQPPTSWPDCALAFVIQGDQMKALDRQETSVNGKTTKTSFSWSSAQLILAAGDPRISQTGDCNEQTQPDLTMHDPNTPPPPPPPAPYAYCYGGMRPTASDTAGRIIAFTTWPAACGPTVPEGSNDHPENQPLFPGLARVGIDCTAGSLGALRAAAAASEDVAIKSDASMHAADPKTAEPDWFLIKAHWIRDGDH